MNHAERLHRLQWERLCEGDLPDVVATSYALGGVDAVIVLLGDGSRPVSCPHCHGVGSFPFDAGMVEGVPIIGRAACSLCNGTRRVQVVSSYRLDPDGWERKRMRLLPVSERWSDLDWLRDGDLHKP